MDIPADENATHTPAEHVVVVAGGDGPHAISIDAADVVIAADSGADIADRLGLSVDVVVGDLDSISPEMLAHLRDEGAAVQAHDPSKDASDLELALAVAAEHQPRRITVIGGDRGRLGHLLVNTGVIASPALAGASVEWVTTDARTHVVRGGETLTIEGHPGDQVTLVAHGGTVHDIVSSGLRWSLAGRSLEPTSSLGLSNELIQPTATVEVGDGTLLIIHEGHDS